MVQGKILSYSKGLFWVFMVLYVGSFILLLGLMAYWHINPTDFENVDITSGFEAGFGVSRITFSPENILVLCQSYFLAKAASKTGNSILFICDSASMTRLVCWGSPLDIIFINRIGTTCQDRPKRSLSQPQRLSDPPLAVRLSQK